jgi:hypothetical protein
MAAVYTQSVCARKVATAMSTASTSGARTYASANSSSSAIPTCTHRRRTAVLRQIHNIIKTEVFIIQLCHFIMEYS